MNNNISILIKEDSLSKDTYKSTGFNASTTTTVPFSYTSTRVMKPVYNSYQKNDFKVIGYLSDQCQYDSRLDGDMESHHAGRGYDISQVDARAYDKIILATVGILGDQTQNSERINKAANQFGISTKWSPVLVDPFADVLSHRNVGFKGDVKNTDNIKDHFDEKNAQGILGGLRLLKEKNPNLSLSVSVGGWDMSEPFHVMVQSRQARSSFIDGMIDLYNRFPMLNEIDLNWMYPGSMGNPQNTFDVIDGKHYVMLITEMKQKLSSIGRHDIRINIALPGCVDALKKLPIDELCRSGLSGITLVTTDFFRAGVSEHLTHQSNLNEYANSHWSIVKPVEYLFSVNVPSKMIFIGFVGHSRNAIGVNIKSVSNLSANFDNGSEVMNQKYDKVKPTGSFRAGVTEYQDILSNYIDFESGVARNGFELYTDTIANADFLYSSHSKLFLSIDTPRTVRAKAEFVRSKGLGGMWTWSLEEDRGILVNAAREGFDCKVTHPNIDMSKFYFKGKDSL